MSLPHHLTFHSTNVIPPRWLSASAALEDHWGEDYDVRWMTVRVSLGCFLYRFWGLPLQTQQTITEELRAMLRVAEQIDASLLRGHEQLVVVARIWEAPLSLQCWIQGLLAMIECRSDVNYRLMAADDLTFALCMRRVLSASGSDVFDVVPRNIQRDEYRPVIEAILGL